MATTTSTDLTVDEGTADAGLPLPEPQDVDGPIFKQVWQTQTDALDATVGTAPQTDAGAHAEPVDEGAPEAADEPGDEHGGSHSA